MTDLNLNQTQTTLDDVAIDINPIFTKHSDELGTAFAVNDHANLYQAADNSSNEVILSPISNNMSIILKGFDDYAVIGHSDEFSTFIAKQNLSSADENNLAEICNEKINEGCALIFGSIDYYDTKENRYLGKCYSPVIYAVKPNQNTYKLLPINVVQDYIKTTYEDAFSLVKPSSAQSVDNISPVLTKGSRKKNHELSSGSSSNKSFNLEYFSPTKVAMLAAAAFIVPVAIASVMTIKNQGKGSDYNSRVQQQNQAFADSKNPSDALKAMAKEPVMLLDDKGTVKKTSPETMANLQ